MIVWPRLIKTATVLPKITVLTRDMIFYFRVTRLLLEWARNFPKTLKTLQEEIPVRGIPIQTRSGKYATRAINFLKNNKQEIPGDRPLSADEKKQRDTLKKMGLPTWISRALALHPPSAKDWKNAQKYARSNFIQKNTKKNREKNPLDNLLITNKAVTQERKKRPKEKAFDPFAKLLGKNKKNAPKNRNRIINFVQEAEKNVGIQGKNLSLFAIISNRYKVSALERVGHTGL